MEAAAAGPDVQVPALTNQGKCLALLGRYAAAEASFRESGDLFERLESPGAIALTRLLWGRSLTAQGRLPEAEEKLLQALPALREAYGEDHPRVGEAAGELVEVYERMGRREKAEELPALAEDPAVRASPPTMGSESSPPVTLVRRTP